MRRGVAELFVTTNETGTVAGHWTSPTSCSLTATLNPPPSGPAAAAGRASGAGRVACQAARAIVTAAATASKYFTGDSGHGG